MFKKRPELLLTRSCHLVDSPYNVGPLLINHPQDTTLNNPIFLACPKGVENLLVTEAENLGLTNVSETVGGVKGEGDLQVAYRLCLWSRLASRVFWVLTQAPVTTMETLKSHLNYIDWGEHIRPSGTFKVQFNGRLKDVDNELFGALRVKDIIVDQFRESTGIRPSIDKETPDIVVDVKIRKGQATIALDMSGDPLHKRGYRQKGSRAPLKENLAAAILLRAGWPEVAQAGGGLIDPMCGSGTFLVEAACIAGDRAPGLGRQYFGFLGWKQHNRSLWNELLTEARDRRAQGFDQIPPLLGYDADPRVIKGAQINLGKAGLEGKAWVYQKELADWVKPTHVNLAQGLLICNPPYGERLGEVSALTGLYRRLGTVMKEQLPGWKAGVFTGNPDLGKHMGIRSHKQYRLFNGPIDCKLLNFSIEESYFHRESTSDVQGKGDIQSQLSSLPNGAQMFANRLLKNLKKIDKWARKNSVEAYRLYDADMPEYAVAIDRYQDWLHVSEYKAPAKIPEEKTRERMMDVLAALPIVTGVSMERIALKERSRQKGKQQYDKFDNKSTDLVITEGQVQLKVNLTEYLDTGLFLDHRPIRQYIADHSKDKRFLNLYAYTGTASVHAARGGAKETVSVDLSNTYLSWARANFELNGFSDRFHHVQQGDCKAWLRANRQQSFDLIFMDPPTFSNSKRMKDTLDIQRDHVDLVKQCMAMLNPGGQLIFSNNRRGFKLDPTLDAQFKVKDVTQWSIPEDFARNKKIHQCWIIEN